MARGNGKTGLVAGLACALVDPEGPMHGLRREVVCVASSFGQARIVFEDCLVMLSDRYPGVQDRREWRVQDSANVATVQHRESGARIRCIGSDPRRAHGLRPTLVLADEPAQWPTQTGEKMLAALRTGLGKVQGSRLVALGTRPDSPEHWFEKMLAGGAGYAQTHAARRTDPEFRLATIRRANPSMAHLPSLRARIETERRDARKDPALLAQYRALRLNRGVSDVVEAVLLSAETWEGAERDVPRQGAAYWGVDLGTSAAQSAVAAYWPESGRLEAVAAFSELPDFRERGLRDGVGRLYLECWKRGELVHAGQRAVNIGELLQVALARFGPPKGIAADRWRDAELRDALAAADVPLALLEARGQGYRDGAEDVREFRRAVLEGRVAPALSLLLRAAMAEARVVTDPAGNAKLAKKTEGGRRATARDDAAAAAILAVALGSRRRVRSGETAGLRYAIVG